MHPACFKEAVSVIAGGQRLAVLSEDDDRFRSFGKLEHVIAQNRYARRQCRLVVFGEGGACIQGLVVTVALELSAPDSADIEIILAVVFKDADINRIAAAHRVGLRYERSCRLVADGDSEP